ncbi:acetate kinase, partial [candidate division KSB1 bacterium]|nr:acetate kinase [candidate division KSB1 bacterium]
MKIIVFNCGSSSIKYKLFEMPEATVLANGIVERIGSESSAAQQKAGEKKMVIEEKIDDHEQGISVIKKMLIDSEKGAIESLSEIHACGHRVVHGGEAFTNSVL